MMIVLLITAAYWIEAACDVSELKKKEKKVIILYSVIFLFSYIVGILPGFGVEVPKFYLLIDWIVMSITGIK